MQPCEEFTLADPDILQTCEELIAIGKKLKDSVYIAKGHLRKGGY